MGLSFYISVLLLGCCTVGLGNKVPPPSKSPCSGLACPSKVLSRPPNSGTVRPPQIKPTPSMSQNRPKKSHHAPGGSWGPPGASMNKPHASAARPHPSPARSHSGPQASRYPKPSMPPQESGKLEPKEFLAKFYGHFYGAVHIAMKQRQEKGMGASMRVMPTPHPSKRPVSARVMPSPQSQKKDVPQVPNQLIAEIDAIFGLLASDFLGKRFTAGSVGGNNVPSGMPMKGGQQSIRIKPTPAPGQKQELIWTKVSQELQMFRAMIKQGLQGRKQCLKELLLRGNVDVKNNTMYGRYVERHMKNITMVYFKFVKWLTKVKQEMPCSKDCQNIERMVAFCKNQYKACGGDMSKGSIRIMPTPGGIPVNKCPKDQKMCPFRQGCFLPATHCIDSRNPFVDDPRQPPTAPPMTPRRSVGMGSKAWNLRPTPSPMPHMNLNDTLNRTVFAMAFKTAVERNPNLDHKELVRLYKFMQGAIGGKGMGNGNGNAPPNSTPQEKQSHDTCINMCPKKNMTYCWPEMKCKRRGAHCNFMHLAMMMNTSTFENMTKCEGSFYCPITGNCTRDAKSCDPSNSRIFNHSPRNETCLTPDMAKPANISRDMAEMFGIRCKPTMKYCPGRYGCVMKKENCTRSKDLRVVLKKNDEAEKKIFCRIRDLICPSVYYTWVKMKRACPEQIKPTTEERPHASKSLPPWVRPTRSAGPPGHSKGGKPHPTHIRFTVRPTGVRPTKATSGQPMSTPIPSVPKLKTVILDVSAPLRGQMKFLSRLVNYIAVVVVNDCPITWKYITPSKPQGVLMRIPKKTNAPRMKAVVVPLDAVVKYELNDRKFHGVCIMKYYKYTLARGVRPSGPMEVDVDQSMSSGDLFFVVFPKPPPCDVQLSGRDFVEILEDTKHPPIFKLRNFIRMRNDSGPLISRMPSALKSVLSVAVVEKYERIIQAAQNKKCTIAIVGYQGTPWRDGTWKFKGHGALKSFSSHVGKLRPLYMSCNDSVTFYPKPDFDGKVCLFIRGACGEVVNGKQKFQLGDRDIKFCVHVKGQPDPPKFTTTFSCLTPLPFLMPKNDGFSIRDIIKFGKRSCGNTRFSGVRGEPLVAGLPIGKETNVGIAVVVASMPKDIGGWEYKTGNKAFSALTKMTFKDGKAVCLNASSVLRFKPKNITTLWSVTDAMRSVWVKVLLWGPRHANGTGICNITDMSNGLFSPANKPIQLSLQRKGCDDVAGSEKSPDLCGKCGKKKFGNIQCACDGRPNSGAVLDQCRRCSGGTTGRVFHKRDCADKCYANGTTSENFEDGCGVCQVRKYARKQARDCNNACSFGKKRACTNKCGICVGGNTGKALNDGINDCGGCRANSSSACVKKLIMHSAAKIGANEKFKLVLRGVGFVWFRKLKCFVQKTGGSLIEIGDGFSSSLKPIRPAVIDEDKCTDEPSREYQVRLQPTISAAGTYTVTCKVDKEVSAMSVEGGSLEVISSGSAITGYHPTSIPTGENVTIVIKGTGFTNTPGAICRASCETSKPGTKGCMMEAEARFINATAVECKFLSTMQAQEINLHLLSSTAVTEPKFSRSRPVIIARCPPPRVISAKFTSGIRRIKIKLSGAVSLAAGIRAGCSSLFAANTANKFGKEVSCYLRNDEILIFLSSNPRVVAEATGNKVQLAFSNNHLRCRGQKFSVAGSGSTQNVEISLPIATVKAVISNGGETLGSCDKMNFFGYKSKGGEGGKLQYFWELFKGANSQGPNKTRSWFKVEGTKLDPKTVYTCKLCVQNMFRQSDCTTKTFRTIDNQNSSLILRIKGGENRNVKAAKRYRMRPHVKISQCGKAPISVSTLRYIWELKSKDPSDDATLKNNDRSVLEIKSGDLTAGKNYTLKLLVTDEKDSTLTAEAAVELSVTGSPLQARIRGGKEMTVGCNGKAVFDARTSKDPDATKAAARVTWECTEDNGRPCFKTSDPTKRLILEEKDQVSMDVNGSLECNKTYVFKMTYAKDSRSSSASIKLTTKPGSPSEVKLDYKKVRNKVIFEGYMSSKSAANAKWKCVEEEGFDILDFTDKTLVKVVGTLSMRPNKRQSPMARRPRLILSTNNLAAGTKYKIQLEVTNEDGLSTAETIVTPPSPPVKGEVAIEPAEGKALNTSFTISADVGWGTEGEDLTYEFGYEQKTRRGVKEIVIKPFSEDNVLEDVKLPPGLDDENSTLSLYVKAKNADGLTSKGVKKIRCRKPRSVSSSEVADFMARSKKAVMEGNYEEANRIMNALSETVNNAEVNGSAVNEDMTTQTVSILEQATDDTRPGILSTLQSTTKPSSSGSGLQGGTKEAVAKTLHKAFSPEKITQPSSKRKRRSVGVTVTETFTPKTTEEVESSMDVFDNIIDENEISNFQDNMKKNFTDTVPSLLRSLCAGLVSSDEYLIAKNNLSTIRSNRLTAATFDTTDVNLTDGSATSKLLLGSELKEKYENWNCSNSGLLCTELCVGTVLYHHNMYPGEFSGRVSDIADVILVHPETYALENPGSLTTGMQYDLALNEIPDPQHTIECRTWNAAGVNWTTDGCVTIYSGGASVACNCTTFDSVTAFKVQKPIITTLFPQVITNATSVQSTSSTGNSSSSAGISPTASSSTSAGQRDSQNAVVVIFKFNVDYNTYAYDSKYNTLKQSIINMLVDKLNISESRIVNLEMKSGSIIVTFTLLNNSGYSNEGNVANIQALITSLAQNGSLVVTLHDGTKVSVDAASLVFAPPTTTMPPKPHPKPKKKDHVVIIIVVVVAVVVAIIVLILVRYYMIQRARKSKMDDGRTQSSTMLVIDNIKLQDRRSPEADTTYNNQAYDKSPALAHRKDPSPPPAYYEKPKTPSTPPSYEKPRTPTTPLPEKPNTPGGTVTAGIGSSVSLKDKYFNS